MKTKSNTVDCIGKNFEESRRWCIDEFSKAAMQNRLVIRNARPWCGRAEEENSVVAAEGDRNMTWAKSFRAADQAGGDAFTRVELKKQSLF
eukprot:CAMPEP_0201870896 /NCGR_PEP_ID=MMETSP0902-20130614/3925_1 /ASSEMBLY_ACC=CAM_ASM_000551 /TAXON_ID=420261 /ORGANISM="Thalassiosira antarctica, Strain CCMP982" /LENGTH=90 /DNA_ID=CAMNT_0048396693 /DNA_START=64 /DNA_END=336 /DNA_ORIENTATION=-